MSQDLSALMARPIFRERLSSITGLSVDEAERLLEPGEPRAVPIVCLGHSITVRPGTSDVLVLRDASIGQYHLPPSPPRTILDLGAHIGTTVAHFAHLYPQARIYGIELDAANFSLCEQNVAPWSDGCELLPTPPLRRRTGPAVTTPALTCIIGVTGSGQAPRR